MNNIITEKTLSLMTFDVLCDVSEKSGKSIKELMELAKKDNAFMDWIVEQSMALTNGILERL